MASSPKEFAELGRSVVDAALASFRADKGWADKAVAQLPDEKLHLALDSNTNSIAVIMKHVAGNLLSRWTDFLTTDGEKPCASGTTSSLIPSPAGTNCLPIGIPGGIDCSKHWQTLRSKTSARQSRYVASRTRFLWRSNVRWPIAPTTPARSS